MSRTALAHPHVTGTRLTFLLGATIVAHCALTALRVPHVVVARRIAEVGDMRAAGDATWLLASARLGGADVIERLRDETGEDAIIAARGPFKGPLEFAPRLLWPRLLARADYLVADATEHAGRPIAPFVLVSDGATLHLEAR